MRYLGVATDKHDMSSSRTASFLQNLDTPCPHQKILLYMEHMQGGSLQQ